MQAIVIDRFGGVDVLELRDLGVPQPSPDEVLVRVERAGINPVDWRIRDGARTAVFPVSFPWVPGWDLSGTVEQAGAGVTGLAAGDEVFGCLHRFPAHVINGAYAAFVTVPADRLIKKPAAISHAAAAAMPVPALTAWQALLETGRLEEGQQVLVRGGAGGVGSIAIQIARHRGANVITTASARNHDYVTGLGAEHAIDYTAGNELEQIRALAPAGIDLLFDCVGIETVNDLVPAVKAGGRVVTIAGVPDEKIWREQGLADGRRIVMRNEPEQLRQLAELLAAGHLSPTPVREYALADAAAAHEESAAGHVRGKLLLVPEHGD